MILRSRQLIEFEREYQRKEKCDLKSALRILDGLYRESIHLGVFPLRDPLSGLENDIKIARAINSV